MTTITNDPIARTMLAQIGRSNVLAVSGGRVRYLAPGRIELPVRYGYSVIAEYDPARDLYDVHRVFTRGLVRTFKGSAFGVFADQVGDAAYRASCYRDSFGEHKP